MQSQLYTLIDIIELLADVKSPEGLLEIYRNYRLTDSYSSSLKEAKKITNTEVLKECCRSSLSADKTIETAKKVLTALAEFKAVCFTTALAMDEEDENN